jgi:hypothetical protein
VRQLLSTAIVALVVAALTAVTVSAVAQSPAETPVSPAALNADTVDGLHAVKATKNTKARANKLVATNAKGFLPSNIVKAVTGVKVTRVAGPKSSPQADGVTFAYAYCPEGSLIVGGGADIDTGNDGSAANVTHFLSNQPGGPRNWFARAWKQLGTGGTYQVQAFAICLSTEPAGYLSLAGKVNNAATKTGR